MPTPSTTCCPSGYFYIDNTGKYQNSYGVYAYVTCYLNAAMSYTVTYGKCGQFNGTCVYSLVDPIDCPACCPSGYIYTQWNSKCFNAFGTTSTAQYIDPIPCITCTCTTLPDPTCPTCGTGGQHLSFSWDFTRKNCTTCPPQDENNPCGPIQSFLPSLYLDPITSTFILRNKNFI